MTCDVSAPSLAQRLVVRERPVRSAAMFQTWSQLLFLHWRWDAEAIQRTLPAGLTVDTFDGSAWLGIVPFFMRNIRPRFCPCVPWVSNFLELNVRTYVFDANGRPGVWFYSLDCNQPVAVWTARTFFHLPYQHSRMNALIPSAGMVDYTNHRKGDKKPSRFCYTLSKETMEAQPGSLEFFLVERYLLHSSTPRGLRCGQVHHAPYQVAKADMSAWDTRVLHLNGFTEPSRAPDHVCGSPGVDVSIFALQ